MGLHRCTACRLLGDCSATAWRLLGDCSATACPMLGWSRKRQFPIEKAAKTQPNGVSGIYGPLLCASPLKMCPSPKRGAQFASEWSIFPAQNHKATCSKIDRIRQALHTTFKERSSRLGVDLNSNVNPIPIDKNAQKCSKHRLRTHTFDQ